MQTSSTSLTRIILLASTFSLSLQGAQVDSKIDTSIEREWALIQTMPTTTSAEIVQLAEASLDFVRQNETDNRATATFIRLNDRLRGSSVGEVTYRRWLVTTLQRTGLSRNTRKWLLIAAAYFETSEDDEISTRSTPESLRVKIDALNREFPGLTAAASLEVRHAILQLKYSPEQARQRLVALSEDNTLRETIKNSAKQALIFHRLRSEPLDLAFTALDGRSVEFSKLRGKVVLLDFWATWCAPCVAELPNVKSVYDRYHEKGFEVVAISLDQEKDRQKLVTFLVKHNYSWPQSFDGRLEATESEISRRFAVGGIPLALLFDKSGRLVDTFARGSRLEARVRRELGFE